MLAAGLGALALALTAVGLFGLMAYSVTQRTREIGVRMALGARGSDVVLMTVRQGLRLTALGLLIGLWRSRRAISRRDGRHGSIRSNRFESTRDPPRRATWYALHFSSRQSRSSLLTGANR